MEPVLVDGEWRAAAATGSFRALNPASGRPLDPEFPVSELAEVERALAAAARLAGDPLAFAPERLAAFLERFASGIEARADEAVAVAHRETALPEEPRLRSLELPRTTDQLRQAATACRDRSWCRATIDTARNIRSMYGPLGGAVVVLGPNNFPFAFNPVSGGDFAAAIAAGNPVLAKANPGHPATTRLLAEVAFEALVECDLPRALVQLVYHLPPADGLRLAAHPLVGAIAFTGSRAAGLELKRAADRAGTPIFLEMSGTNPVLVLPGALAERGDDLARDLVASCTLGAGQLCTKPGLVLLLADRRGEQLLLAVAEQLAHQPPGILLGEGTLRRLEAVTAALLRGGAELQTGGHPLPGPGFRFANTLFRVSGRRFLEDPGAFQSEVFGPIAVAVLADGAAEVAAVVRALEGSLAGAVYSHSAGLDDPLYHALEPVLRRKVGRLLNDRMPTGVAVSPAMHHGGPYPATGHPGFTAVGIPAALLRFGALRCYDDVREHRLPPELRDANPTGTMWRWVDGEPTRADVARAPRASG